jgi:AbrB family looped-hinge helix DNA binding protein
VKITIDGSGRVVVPKPVRDQLKLDGGTLLEVVIRGDELVMTAVATPMHLVRRGKGMVAVSDVSLPTLSAEDVRSAIESQRR